MATPFPHLQHWPIHGLDFDDGRRGRWLTRGHVLKSNVFVDLDAWPPEGISRTDEYVTSFDVLPDGCLLNASGRPD
jgi:hypothetical protein